MNTTCCTSAKKSRADKFLDACEFVVEFVVAVINLGTSLIFTHRGDHSYFFSDEVTEEKGIGLWQFCDGCVGCDGSDVRNRLNMFGYLVFGAIACVGVWYFFGSQIADTWNALNQIGRQ